MSIMYALIGAYSRRGVSLTPSSLRSPIARAHRQVVSFARAASRRSAAARRQPRGLAADAQMEFPRRRPTRRHPGQGSLRLRAGIHSGTVVPWPGVTEWIPDSLSGFRVDVMASADAPTLKGERQSPSPEFPRPREALGYHPSRACPRALPFRQFLRRFDEGAVGAIDP